MPAHGQRIMQKLELHHIEEVIDCAIRHGVVHLGPAPEPPTPEFGAALRIAERKRR